MTNLKTSRAGSLALLFTAGQIMELWDNLHISKGVIEAMRRSVDFFDRYVKGSG